MRPDAIWPRETIRTLFQPIVALETGEITGYEALSRGPSGELEGGRALFRAAGEEGLADLDRACAVAAVVNAGALPRPVTPGSRLFVNVLADSLLDTGLARVMEEACARAGLPPSRLVLEITEPHRVGDFRVLASRLAPFRELGMEIGLDDVGAGFAGLRLYAEIDLDYVKIDRSLVRGIDRDVRRRSLVEVAALVSRRQGLTAVAEGIETEGELRALQALGIEWGQGYFLGRPAVGFEPVAPEALAVLRGPGSRVLPRPTADFGSPVTLTVGQLVVPTPTVSRGTRVREALEAMESRRIDALVVLDEGRPWGLVRRQGVLELLARPFGREVYLRKPLEAVAETGVLVVDSAIGLEQASRLAMARPDAEVYSHVVVTEGDRYAGLVSIRQLLDALSDFRLESARYANPLTGLPGNQTIEAVIRGRLREGGAVGVMHADLDAFKAFNDRYGFHRGDEAIRFTAQLLAEVIARDGGEEAFLGHIGGDDFVVVVAGEQVVPIAAAIQALFRERVGLLYPDVDRARGYVVARSRTGERRRFPLMDITVASTVITDSGDRHFAHVLDTLAEAKREAKARAQQGRRRS